MIDSALNRDVPVMRSPAQESRGRHWRESGSQCGGDQRPPHRWPTGHCECWDRWGVCRLPKHVADGCHSSIPAAPRAASAADKVAAAAVRSAGCSRLPQEFPLRSIRDKRWRIAIFTVSTWGRLFSDGYSPDECGTKPSPTRRVCYQ